MKKLFLISLCALHLQCFNFIGDKCSPGLFELNDRIGDYEFSEIPDMSIGMRDTLWINPSTYNRAFNACDYAYGDFYPDLAVSDPEILRPVRIDNHFALVGISTGKTKVRFIGGISLRRNGQDIRITENMEMNVSVTKSRPFSTSDTLRPEITTTPSFVIEDIIFENSRSKNWMHLDFIKSPDLVNNRSDWGNMSFIFSNNFNPDSAHLITFEDDQGFDSFTIEIDSVYTHIIGILDIGNEASYNSQTGEQIPGVNRRTGRTFYIRSYPVEAPVSERTFEIVYMN